MRSLRHDPLFARVAIASLIAGLVLGLVAPAGAATLVASFDGMQGWSINTTTCGATPPTSQGKLVNGPATPPLGTGSVEFKTGADGNSVAQITHAGYNLVRLDTITALSYSTYVTTNVGGQGAYMRLDIDHNGDTTRDDSIFFEPVYQNGGYVPSLPNQGNLTLGTWQTWNALIGGWWSNTTPGMGPGSNMKSFAHYLSVHPDARIVNNPTFGGFRVVAGCGAGAWPNFIGNTDNVTIGIAGSNTTYNFEATYTPSTVTSSYADQVAETIERPDPLGTGTATASASAVKATGVVEVDTKATDTMLAGTDNPLLGGIGSSEARASARIAHDFAVAGPATYRVRLTLNVTSAVTKVTDAPGYPSIPPFRQTYSSVQASASFGFANCAPGTSCPNVFDVSDVRLLAASYEAGAAPGTVVLEGIVEVPGTGKIRVDGGLHAASNVRGFGESTAHGKATVVSISIALA